jgi:hypothetical protein
MAINSKKDLDKKEKCAMCGDMFERRGMRGTTNGDWLCVPDWEDKHGSAAPPPTPSFSVTRANG